MNKTTSIDEKSFKETAKEKIHHLMESTPFITIMTVLMIWILFQDDVRLIFLTAQQDYIFNIISVILCAIFVIELVLESLIKEKYFLRFYFWLDVVCILTIIFDIGWVHHLIFGDANTQGIFIITIALLSTKSSKMGSKAARFVRAY